MSTKNDISLIFRPLFIISVLLLALNDWVLKAMFHNFITGKLSDFAGIFAFAIFAFACIPSKKVFISWGIAFAFCWWKSPFSDSFIAFWSSHFFEIERTIDMTDLLAILVLPFANRYANADFVRFYPKKYAIYLMSFMVCAVFMATSRKIHYVELTIPRVYILPNQANSSNRDTEMYNFIQIDSAFSAMVVHHIDKEDYVIKDEYQQNQILKNFADGKNIANHYQIDSLSGQKINQTDPKGQKQGIWKFSNENIFYVIHYQNDVLHGNYTILDGKQPKIEGNFANNLAEGNWNFYDSIGKIKEKRIYSKGETIKKYIGDTEKNIDSRQSFKNKVAWALAFEVLLLISFIIWLIKECMNASAEKADSEVHILFIFVPLLTKGMYFFLSHISAFAYFCSEVPAKWSPPPLDLLIGLGSILLMTMISYSVFLLFKKAIKHMNLRIVLASFLVYFVFYVLFNQFRYWELL